MFLKTELPDPWQVRPLTLSDAHGLEQVQTECYDAEFLESREVFTRRLACEHQCSLGIVKRHDTALHAYLVAYWSQLGAVTPLHGDFLVPNAEQSVLYLHDMSVRPALAGRGMARHLLRTVISQARARGLTQAALVAVQGAQTYWARHGFVHRHLQDDQQQANLDSYGEGACYMVAPL